MTTLAGFVCQEWPLGSGLYLVVREDEIFAADSLSHFELRLFKHKLRKGPLGSQASLATDQEISGKAV